MIATVALLLATQSKFNADVFTQEARFIKNLSETVTWGQINSTVPKGCQFEQTGFTADGEVVGNMISITGPLKAKIHCLSKFQATTFMKWQADPKGGPFPSMPLLLSDRVLEFEIEIANGKLPLAKTENEYKQRTSILLKEWGDLKIEPWQNSGFIDLNWKSPDLTYSEFDEPEFGSRCTFKRTFSVDYSAKAERGEETKLTRADYDALKAVISGKSQTRLVISPAQIKDLRGWTLQPWGWKPKWIETNDGSAFVIKKNEAPMAIHVYLLHGKRIITVYSTVG